MVSGSIGGYVLGLFVIGGNEVGVNNDAGESDGGGICRSFHVETGRDVCVILEITSAVSGIIRNRLRDSVISILS